MVDGDGDGLGVGGDGVVLVVGVEEGLGMCMCGGGIDGWFCVVVDVGGVDVGDAEGVRASELGGEEGEGCEEKEPEPAVTVAHRQLLIGKQQEESAPPRAAKRPTPVSARARSV